MYKIIEGPAKVANRFGYWGHDVPPGGFVVVKTGELTNGGQGPIACSVILATRDMATTWLKKCNKEEQDERRRHSAMDIALKRGSSNVDLPGVVYDYLKEDDPNQRGFAFYEADRQVREATTVLQDYTWQAIAMACRNYLNEEEFEEFLGLVRSADRAASLC